MRLTSSLAAFEPCAPSSSAAVLALEESMRRSRCRCSSHALSAASGAALPTATALTCPGHEVMASLQLRGGEERPLECAASDSTRSAARGRNLSGFGGGDEDEDDEDEDEQEGQDEEEEEEEEL